MRLNGNAAIHLAPIARKPALPNRLCSAASVCTVNKRYYDSSANFARAKIARLIRLRTDRSSPTI